MYALVCVCVKGVGLLEMKSPRVFLQKENLKYLYMCVCMHV